VSVAPQVLCAIRYEVDSPFAGTDKTDGACNVTPAFIGGSVNVSMAFGDPWLPDGSWGVCSPVSTGVSPTNGGWRGFGLGEPPQSVDSYTSNSAILRRIIGSPCEIDWIPLIDFGSYYLGTVRVARSFLAFNDPPIQDLETSSTGILAQPDYGRGALVVAANEPRMVTPAEWGFVQVMYVKGDNKVTVTSPAGGPWNAYVRRSGMGNPQLSSAVGGSLSGGTFCTAYTAVLNGAVGGVTPFVEFSSGGGFGSDDFIGPTFLICQTSATSQYDSYSTVKKRFNQDQANCGVWLWGLQEQEQATSQPTTQPVDYPTDAATMAGGLFDKVGAAAAATRPSFQAPGTSVSGATVPTDQFSAVHAWESLFPFADTNQFYLRNAGHGLSGEDDLVVTPVFAAVDWVNANYATPMGWIRALVDVALVWSTFRYVWNVSLRALGVHANKDGVDPIATMPLEDAV
jgi:hypothetical protein